MSTYSLIVQRCAKNQVGFQRVSQWWISEIDVKGSCGSRWFSVSRRRISNFPNDSGTFSRLVGEGWRRLAKVGEGWRTAFVSPWKWSSGRQCAIARWNWQKHATLQRASEYWIWIFGSGCPKLLGDLTKLKALKETQTPSKDTPPNIIAVRLAGNLESQSSIPPKRCYEVGIRKTQLKSNKYPTNIQHYQYNIQQQNNKSCKIEGPQLVSVAIWQTAISAPPCWS